MSEVDAQSREQTGEFSAINCTNQTLRRMTIPDWESLGAGIEERYIPEAMCLPATGINYMPDMVTALRDFATRDLTIDTLTQVRKTYDQAQHQVGPTLEATAAEHGLTEVMTPAAVFSQLSKEYYETEADLVSRVHAEFGETDPARSWKIIPTQQEEPILLRLHQTDNKEPMFSVVYLDQLYQNEATRAVLLQVIQGYHQARAQYAAAGDIIYNQALHQIATDIILPDTFIQYGRAEADKKDAEAAGIESYMIWLAQTGGYTKELQRLRDGVRHRHTLLEDGKFVLIENYLEHRATCPGEPETVRNEVAAQTALLRIILAAGTEGEPLGPKWISFLPILQEPYAAILDPATLPVIANKQALLNAAQAMQGLETKGAVFATLLHQAPNMHYVVTRFDLWLYKEGIKLNDIYAKGVAVVKEDAEPDAAQAVHNEINRELKRIIETSTSQEITGQYPNPDTLAVVNNPYLTDALTLLAIQQASGEKAGLLDQWISRQENELEEYRASVAHRAQELQIEAGISRQDIERLIGLVNSDNSESDRIFGRRKAFGILFNALLLQRYGVVDLSSPVFKSFLREFIGPVRPQSDGDTGEVKFE